ncbi:unnamed protein product [Mytilus edulis]|uniref:Transposase IS30-like HTH domain-containing protein n=1 Tax=Mytilus edulis TaxID=6550 RepID=A0A8S3SUX6_MYTED|nr:unnamed protein product [Mytilus edulis]
MAPKRKELSLSEKNAIAALHKAGMKGPDIARQTRHPLPTIYGVLNRFKGRRSLENKERTGRPNLLTPRDTRKLCTTVKSDRKRPLHEITAVFNESREEPVSKRTVQRKLYEKRVVKKSIRIRDLCDYCQILDYYHILSVSLNRVVLYEKTDYRKIGGGALTSFRFRSCFWVVNTGEFVNILYAREWHYDTYGLLVSFLLMHFNYLIGTQWVCCLHGQRNYLGTTGIYWMIYHVVKLIYMTY